MADVAVRLNWTGTGLEFDGGALGGPAIRIDGERASGPSPMQLLLLSLAGCMAVDVVSILQKMRAPLTGLEVSLEGDRAASPPRRLTRIRLRFETRGLGPEHEAQLERAVALSEQTYCSVLHTLRPDVETSTVLVLG